MGCLRDFLEPDKFYHIYNHANGDDKLFREERNYSFFMQKIEKYIVPCCDIYSYCLIPNHFHFALRVKSEHELIKIWEDKLDKKLSKLILPPTLLKNPSGFIVGDELVLSRLKTSMIEKLLSEQFSHCFNSYVQAYNKVYNRMGSLMKERFQRKNVDSERYLKSLICYIHNNPVNHGIVKSPSNWSHSSYNTLFTDDPTFIKRTEVIELFGSIENLVAEHRARIAAGRAGGGGGAPTGFDLDFNRDWFSD